MRSFVALSFIGLAAAQKGRQTSAPVYSCPPPFELTGKQCTRQSSAPAQAFCTSGILQNGACLTPAASRESSCPPGATPTGAGCAIVETIPAEHFCPANTHDIGGECQQYSVTGIIEVCARGKLVGGQCELTEQTPAMPAKICPVGYAESKDSCWKTAAMDCTPPQQGKARRLAGKGGPHAGSVAGFSGRGGMGGAAGGMGGAGAGAGAGGRGGMGGAGAGGRGGLGGADGMGGFGAPPAIPAPRYMPAPSQLAITNKQCEVSLEAPFASTSSCPAGTTQSGNNCVSKQFEPTTVECSLGAPHLCFPSQTTPANRRCAPGFTLAGDVCEKKVAVPKNTFCGAGMVEYGATCAAAAPAQLRCGPGAQLAGEMCIFTETTAPIVSVNVQCRGKNCFH